MVPPPAMRAGYTRISAPANGERINIPTYLEIGHKRVRPETYSVFSKPCVRGPGRRDGRRDAGASQGRLDAPGREHKAPVGRAGRVPLRRQRPSTMLQHRLRLVSWHGHPSNSLKTRYMSPDGTLSKGVHQFEGGSEHHHDGLPLRRQPGENLPRIDRHDFVTVDLRVAQKP